MYAAARRQTGAGGGGSGFGSAHPSITERNAKLCVVKFSIAAAIVIFILIVIVIAVGTNRASLEAASIDGVAAIVCQPVR